MDNTDHSVSVGDIKIDPDPKRFKANIRFDVCDVLLSAKSGIDHSCGQIHKLSIEISGQHGWIIVGLHTFNEITRQMWVVLSPHLD